MNAGILVLLGVTAGVLAGFLRFIVSIARRSRKADLQVGSAKADLKVGLYGSAGRRDGSTGRVDGSTGRLDVEAGLGTSTT